jgi:hypothetical protein
VRDTPDVFTDANRPLCRSAYLENQGLIHLEILAWLQAGTDRPATPEQDELVRNALAAIFVGHQEPNKVFGWPPPGKKRRDERYTKDVWREQWMAAETLRLVRQDLADDEKQAWGFVADAFGVESKTVKRALDEWRGDLESGDLARYLDYLKWRAAFDEWRAEFKPGMRPFLAYLKTRK